MNIEKHIAALLYRFQCVTLPGFGAFITEVQSVKVSEDGNTFNPPKKIISFNPNVKNNDGLLANHIAIEENISFEKATEIIAFEISRWNISLEKRNRLILMNIGEITMNTDKSLVFEPNSAVNYLTSSFGLNNFNASIITRETLKKQVEKLEENTPILFTPEKRQNYSFIKYAAAILLLFSAGTFGYKIHNDQKVAKETFFTEKLVQKQIQDKIQEATFFISVPSATIELPVKEEIKPYHIIAGAFRNEENALTVVRDLQEKGFPARLLEKNKSGLIPVAYESFSTLVAAQQTKEKIKKEQNAEAWLLIE